MKTDNFVKIKTDAAQHNPGARLLHAIPHKSACLDCCDAQSASEMGHQRRIHDVRDVSATYPIAPDLAHGGSAL